MGAHDSTIAIGASQPNHSVLIETSPALR